MAMEKLLNAQTKGNQRRRIAAIFGCPRQRRLCGFFVAALCLCPLPLPSAYPRSQYISDVSGLKSPSRAVDLLINLIPKQPTMFFESVKIFIMDSRALL